MSISAANGIRIKVFLQGDLSEAAVSGLERIMYGVHIEHHNRREPDWKGFELYDNEKSGRTMEEARMAAIRIMEEGLAEEVLITESDHGYTLSGRLIHRENGEVKEEKVSCWWEPWRD